MDLDGLKRRGKELADKAKEGAEQARIKAGPLAEQAKVKAGEARVKAKPYAEQAREKASHFGDKAGEAISKGADKLQESAKSFSDKSADEPTPGGANPAAVDTPAVSPDPTPPTAPLIVGAPVVTVRYWAGARRAAGTREESLAASDLAGLRALLASRPDLAAIVAASSLLVDGVAPPPDALLHEGSVVDVLPPFAGG